MNPSSLVRSGDQYAEYGNTKTPVTGCQSGGKKYKKRKGGGFFGDLFGVQQNTSSENGNTPT